MEWKAFWNDSPQVRDPDFCRQVGRTFKQVSYSDRQIDALADRMLGLLDASPDKTLLDLACGNGLVTSRLAPHFRSITAIDFSKPLIDAARRHFARGNVEYLLGDATDLTSLQQQYDAVLVSGALQFFDADAARRLLQQCRRVLNDGGRVVLGDVADRDRLWNFYRGLSGRARYALDVIRRRPVIGHWWAPSALSRLAGENGWTLTAHYQPDDFPNHYFRYDAVLEAARPE